LRISSRIKNMKGTVFGEKKVVDVRKNEVVLSYPNDYRDDLSGNSMATILANYSLAAALDVGPRVLSINLGKRTVIHLEKIYPLVDEDGVAITKESPKMIRKAVDNQISRLHRSGYFHSDLHSRNVGYRIEGDKKTYLLLDFDMMLPIESPAHRKIYKKMLKYLELKTIDELLDFDFENWSTGVWEDTSD